MKNATWVVVAAVTVCTAAIALCGCAEIGAPASGGGMDAASGPLELGKLELHYDFASNQGTSAFTPSQEFAARADVSSIGVVGVFGKSVLDKRSDIPALGGAGTGPAAIIGLGIRNAGNYVLVGPRFAVSTAVAANQLYATDGGARIPGALTVYDPDTGGAVANGGSGFLAANDANPTAIAAGNGAFAWTQSYEIQTSEASDALFTVLDAPASMVHYRFYQVGRGAAGVGNRTWAPPYSDTNAGNTGGSNARDESADTDPSNAPTLAMLFGVPANADGITIIGTLYADIVFDANAAWAPSAGGVDLDCVYDLDTALGYAATHVASEVDGDSTGRTYVAHVDAANAINVGRLGANQTVTAADAEIIPDIAGGTAVAGLDVVDAFSKLYVGYNTGALNGQQVNIYGIPANGADGAAQGNLNVGLTAGGINAANDVITDIAVDPTNRVLYVAWEDGGGGAPAGQVVGWNLDANGLPTDTTPDYLSTAGADFDGTAGGGKLAVHPTNGTVYVTTGAADPGGNGNGIVRLTRSGATLVANATRWTIDAANDVGYGPIAVDSTGNLYVAVFTAHIPVYNSATAPDTVGANDVAAFAAAAVPVVPGAVPAGGIVKFDSAGTWVSSTWLRGDVCDGATAQGNILDGRDSNNNANAPGPTDLALFGSTGLVTGAAELVLLSDEGAGAGMDLAWATM